MKSYAFVTLGAVILLSACAETPMGPTVQVMPGPNTSLASFQNDQATCRQFAQQAVSDQVQGANLRGLGTAALTTALGAGLGGAIGGGRGAGIGAAGGALGGAGVAAGGAANTQGAIQAQFDNAFAACMFSLGNTVPSMGPPDNYSEWRIRPCLICSSSNSPANKERKASARCCLRCKRSI